MVADGYFLEQVITGDLRDKHGFHDLEESQQKKKKKPPLNRQIQCSAVNKETDVKYVLGMQKDVLLIDFPVWSDDIL